MNTSIPTVVVVGGTGNQRASIRGRLGGRADVRFVDGNKRGARVTAFADLYVFWVRFCGHSIQREIDAIAPRSRVVLHTGGLGRMAEVIERRLGLAA